MKKPSILWMGAALVLSLGVLACAQFVPSGGEGKASSPINGSALKDHVRYLASDELGGRGPGTPGYEKAAQYVVRQLKSYGLQPLFRDAAGEPSFRQPFVIRHGSVKPEPAMTLQIKGREHPLELRKDFSIRNIDQAYPDQKFQLAYVGYGISEPSVEWDDYAGLEVRNKCLLFEIGAPPELEGWPPSLKVVYSDYDRGNLRKARAAFGKGAACLIAVYPREENLPWQSNVMGKSISKLTRLEREPERDHIDRLVIALGEEVSNRLFEGQPYHPWRGLGRYQSFEIEGALITLHFEVDLKRLETWNIGALVAGTDPQLAEEFVTLGAHLDGLGTVSGKIFNGAADNAVSCAALLEMARLQARTPARRPAAFVFYSGEEMGLLGSKSLLAFSPIPLDQIVINLNFEMVGGLPLFINGTHTGEGLRAVVDEANRSGPRASLGFHLDESEGGSFVSRRSDHYSFHQKGIPFIYLGGGSSHYHRVGDDPDTLNYTRAAKAAWLGHHMAQILGNRDRRP